MSDKNSQNDCTETPATIIDLSNRSLLDISLQYDELNYGELEQSMDLPPFEFSSPISSISSNCSSPDKTVQRDTLVNEDDEQMDDSGDFVSLEELKSQISPPSDDEYSSTATVTRKSILETIYEDIYLETPPGTPSNSLNAVSKRKRHILRTDLSKCDEFKENVQTN